MTTGYLPTFGLLTPDDARGSSEDRRPVATAAVSLRRNVVWTFVGNVVYAGCQWAIVVVIAKLGTPAMVGQFALGLAVAAPVQMLSNLQLRAVQATDANADFEFGHYLALRLMTTALAWAAVVSIATLGWYQRTTAEVIVAVGAAKAVESISDIYYGFLQNRERMERIAQSMMLKGVCSVTAFALAMGMGGSILHATAAMGAVWAAVLLTFDVKVCAALARSSSVSRTARLIQTWDAKQMTRLFQVSAPLGVVMMLLSLNANIPRYFVESRLGDASLGIFAAVGYMSIAGTTIVNALGQAASPRIARYHAAGDRRAFLAVIRQLISLGLVVSASGLVVALCLGARILRLMYGPEYSDASNVLAWFIVASGVAYTASFCGYGITAARQFNIQVPLALSTTVTTTVACMLLVPTFGLVGAVWALGIGAGAQLLGAVTVLRRGLP